jgi:putative transposase
VARCTVERLMRDLGLTGALRGTRVVTTRPGPKTARPADLVQRRFLPLAPNRIWVADFTYVPTWSGMVYVAFVIDAYARHILGWRASMSMRTNLVLDTIEQAIWTRHREGITDLTGVIHHHDDGSQYMSIAFTERLAEAGVDISVGAVGDALDNALAESVIGLFKTETHPTPRTVAHRRTRRSSNPALGRLVQPPPAARDQRRPPTTRA